jgi:hypothetical protein
LNLQIFVDLISFSVVAHLRKTLSTIDYVVVHLIEMRGDHRKYHPKTSKS